MPPHTDHRNHPSHLELWGGHECTVNRVGDNWFDQTLRSGHEHRLSDLELIAGLGVKSLRYPALWERISPHEPGSRDFAWTDERLGEMKRLRLNPILTLCHHGSGPHYTGLLDDSFAPGLAVHAAAVAQRYPWVRDWTPVNEPLTTARFSTLYGFWYPHTTDERIFWLSLLNEIDATRLSMRAIRAVNPAAQLIQTDDLGYCHASEPLRWEADFQNRRRWMGWDLLCGMVVPGHALWDRLVDYGFEDRLRLIADDPCPPSVIGINHYLSSERLLDHRIDNHPDRSIADRKPGDSAGLALVDVDAIRHLRSGVIGLSALLQQAWERYRIPVAVTECHNGATREEQVRWFVEVWNGARELRQKGVDIRAVTAWSLFGSYDWNRMVTRSAGHYECGVFDVRSGEPRPTLMASVLTDLAHGRKPSAPFLAVSGWWRRESRMLDEPAAIERQFQLTPQTRAGQPAPLLIVSDDGLLSHLAIRACEIRALHYQVVDKNDADAALAASAPWGLLDARDLENLCLPVRRVGGTAPWRPIIKAPTLARTCADLGIPCAVFTTAFSPVRAGDDALPTLLTARTGGVYTPWNASSRAVRLLDALDAGRVVEADADLVWDMVYGPDLVDGVLDLLLDGVRGAVTFVPSERWSELEFARQLAWVADRDAGLVRASSSSGAGGPGSAEAPAAMSYLPPAETTMERFVRESRRARQAGDLAVSRRNDDVRLEEA
ncbi:MAG: putative b-glycosidase, Glycoside Hydrolase Family 1 [Polaromonas sp.]|nr:putative b-glycosidase, Glycoside Hydrolase Family 1 [Polaromonas sp.]